MFTISQVRLNKFIYIASKTIIIKFIDGYVITKVKLSVNDSTMHARRSRVLDTCMLPFGYACIDSIDVMTARGII